MVRFTKVVAVAAAWISPAIAHPGEKHSHQEMERDIAAREYWAHAGKRSLDACSASVYARQIAQRNVERRANKVLELRSERGIKARECDLNH